MVANREIQYGFQDVHRNDVISRLFGIISVINKGIFSIAKWPAKLEYLHYTYVNEPEHCNTNERTFAPIEDSDHPSHPPNRIRVFPLRLMDN